MGAGYDAGGSQSDEGDVSERSIDCVVCGEACVDIVIRPIPHDRPLAGLGMQVVDSIRATTGGIVPNAGIAMSRLGLKVSALALVGSDEWGSLIRRRLEFEGVGTEHLVELPGSSSATAVIVDRGGEHTFAFHSGASQRINARSCLDRLDLFAQSRLALFGYYNLLPELEQDLPDVLARVRETGCQTALDTTNGGGTLDPLARILPHLDVYVPSLAEARTQTNETDPEAMIRVYRGCGMRALLGIKLGEEGVLLSPVVGTFLRIPPLTPPGPVVDTTGAGDCFYAGLITGRLRGLSLEQAARLGAAAGACCVTSLGATEGVRSYEATCALARF